MSPPCLPQRGYVVDIYAKFGHCQLSVICHLSIGRRFESYDKKRVCRFGAPVTRDQRQMTNDYLAAHASASGQGRKKPPKSDGWAAKFR
jgi:hypothetical protein